MGLPPALVTADNPDAELTNIGCQFVQRHESHAWDCPGARRAEVKNLFR